MDFPAVFGELALRAALQGWRAECLPTDPDAGVECPCVMITSPTGTAEVLWADCFYSVQADAVEFVKVFPVGGVDPYATLWVAVRTLLA